MNAPCRLVPYAVLFGLIGCVDPSADSLSAPSLHRDNEREGRTVIVDPSGRHGRPVTIQAGIDAAEPSGRVLVLPGTYAEALVINKGVTLQSSAHGHEDEVIVAPPGTPLATIDITGVEPVVIRGLTIHKPGVNGVLGAGAVDITLEHVKIVAVATGAGTNRLVRLTNNATNSGGRARLIVRESFLDGAGLETNAVSVQADSDVRVEDNVIRRTNGICFFFISVTAAGINADVVNNDFDQCNGRTAIDVGPTPTQVATFSTVGVVNIVGNTIRNSTALCLPTTAIHYQLYSGRIEHNTIVGFLQPCAAPITDALPSAIWVGSIRGFASGSPLVRFNDLGGNAHAGLRVAPNIVNSLDARCNHWGSVDGPSGIATGTGDAVLMETGGARPVLAPFATVPTADRGKRDHGHGGDHDFMSSHGHDDDDDDERGGRESCTVEYSLWSEPVNLGPTINTLASEQNPNVSPDGLSLYLVSDRALGQGGLDILVSQRASVDGAWGSAVNLGSVINSPGAESAPSLSDDGRLLYFFSDYSGRPGAQGGQDLYVSRRANPSDDFAWGVPVNLGPYVNTTADEAGSSYVPGERRGRASLYFNRRPIAVPAAPYDLYSVPLTRDGLPRETAAPIAELNSPAGDFGPEVSSDGREVIFGSGRPGTVGGNDLWASIRRSVDDPWSTPENLGTPINTALNDRHPSLSVDGRTLFFASTRSGTLGSDDLWMTTRTRIRSHDH